MTSARVVITDCDHATVDPERDVLVNAGIDVALAQCRTAADVIAAAPEAEVLINQYAPIDAAALGALGGLKAVVRYGVGVDNIDVEAATRHGVWVVNVPDYGVEEVADHALAMLLALLRGLPRLDRDVHNGHWRYEVVRPLHRLSTLTVGVVGCGRIGATLVHKLRGVGVSVVVTDPAGRAPSGARQVELGELLATADAVSLHLPLNADTHHLIDAAALARMKPGAVLVNTSRGGLVDPAALLAALDGGRLAGAGLDVLTAEPPAQDDPLVRHDRVLATPHAAWYSEESSDILKREVAREAVRVLAGERPRSPVNRV